MDHSCKTLPLTPFTIRFGLIGARFAGDRLWRLFALLTSPIPVRYNFKSGRIRWRVMAATVLGVAAVVTVYIHMPIRSPINGVVLEKLVDPNELVPPQSFGVTRGPSTALIAMADSKDLQVEIDLNASDRAKVSLNQQCRVSPEVYLDKVYSGGVAAIALAPRFSGIVEIRFKQRTGTMLGDPIDGGAAGQLDQHKP